jgi:LTXXQ motif family protein
MKTTLIAIALAAAATTAVPILAKPADDPDTLYAQAGPPTGDQRGAEGDRDDQGRGRWPMMRRMMMHRMHGMMRRDPQEWCLDRLAHRAARRAYIAVKLNLTTEQQPLWDKVQSAAQSEEQQERQLCAALKPGAEPTVLERMDRMQQLLQARLNGLQAAKPAVQALYQALTPEQQAILNRPFGRR